MVCTGDLGNDVSADEFLNRNIIDLIKALESIEDKKRIKIYMLHPFVYDELSLVDMLRLDEIVEGEPYEFDFTEEDFDYFIVSEHFFANQENWNKFAEYYKKAKITIYYGGECIFPDMNLFDYAISFDDKFILNDRVSRIPPLMMSRKWIFESDNAIADCAAAKQLLQNKKRFCNYIYTNPDGHIMRKQLFDAISKYKAVDSLGDYLHNCDLDVPDEIHADFRGENIWLKSHYKFSIAAENAAYEGYTSEKLITSLEAHTVPIYWGNPAVAEEFNPKAFINVSEYSTHEDLIKRIREIDENDDLWCEIVSQPWLTEEQQEVAEKRKDDYFMFIRNIFNQDINEAGRRGHGFHPGRYVEWYFNRP